MGAQYACPDLAPHPADAMRAIEAFPGACFDGSSLGGFYATYLAEKLGCDVHVLDDGFQHIELARQLDILVTTVGEIPNGRVIPLGRLREVLGAGGAHVDGHRPSAF